MIGSLPITMVSIFHKLPREVLQLILDSLYLPYIETFPGLRNFKIEKYGAFSDEVCIYTRDFDTIRKLCKATSKVSIPQSLWIHAAYRFLELENKARFFDLVHQPAFKTLVLQRSSQVREAFFAKCTDLEMGQRLLHIDWLRDLVCTGPNQLLEYLDFNRNHIMYKIVFEFIGKDPRREIHSTFRSLDQELWKLENHCPGTNHWPYYAEKIAYLVKCHKKSDNYRKTKEYLDRYGASGSFRTYLTPQNRRAIAICVEHGIKLGRSSRSVFSWTSQKNDKQIQLSILRWLVKDLCSDLRQLAEAVHHGRCQEVDSLLEIIESPSVLNNLFLASAIFRNHLAIARQLMRHVNISRTLYTDDRLFVFCARRRSVEMLTFLDGNFRDECDIKDCYPLSCFPNELRNVFKYDSLATRCVVSSLFKKKNSSESLRYVVHVLPLSFLWHSLEFPFFHGRLVWKFTLVLICLINPRVEPFLIRNRPDHILKALRFMHMTTSLENYNWIIYMLEEHLHPETFPFAEAFRLLQTVEHHPDIIAEDMRGLRLLSMALHSMRLTWET